MSGYAAPTPLKTSGSEGFIAAVDIIVELAAVVVDHVPLLEELLFGYVGVPVVGHPGCLVAPARCWT